MHYNCLIVDDEKPLAESTAEYFNLFGVSTHFVFDAAACLHFWEENTADLILLDINLDGTSGFDLCQILRKTIQVPILFISARSSDDDVMIALSIGGDDYIKKPYSLSVLLAKVKVVLKRFGSKQQKVPGTSIAIDHLAKRVMVGGKPVRLKAMEYKLLCCLLENAGRIVEKEDLFKQVWGDSITGDGTLNVHIRHLREKIEANPNEPVLIKTVWGVGYIFEETNS
ncbi:MAG: response regulator transcription factor [Eubacterium sp.]